jgi:CRP-like cAMP-binding protein
VLLDGEVAVRASDEQGGPAKSLATITAPGYFGEIGIIHAVPRTANVSAVDGCRCALIDGASLLDALSLASASASLMATTQSRLTGARPSLSLPDHAVAGA